LTAVTLLYVGIRQSVRYPASDRC